MNVKSVRNFFLYIFGYLIVQKNNSSIFHYLKKYLPNDKKSTLKKIWFSIEWEYSLGGGLAPMSSRHKITPILNSYDILSLFYNDIHGP
jgi:hypothetical protein